ncbi:MAG: DUF1161 domain-containing protein [Caldimonas sp.]
MNLAATSAACAAALLAGAPPGSAAGAPLTCADTLKKVEKQMADAGVRQPQLKIVPKGLSGSARVLASCENGTQRIVQRADADPSAPKPGPAADGRAPAKSRS